jgi:hypothetical protein
VSDNLRRFFAIMCAILVTYFLLQVLRAFAVAGEARGVCAGIAGYMIGDLVASPRRRRKRS